MKSKNLGTTMMAGGIALLLGLWALQACKTTGPRPSAEAPYLLQFEYPERARVTPAEEKRFVEALKRYTVPEASSVKVGDKELDLAGRTMTTELVLEGSPTPPAKGEMHAVKALEHTYFVRTTANLKDLYSIKHTQRPPEFLARARSTQFLGFKTEEDMRAFVREISTKK